MGLKDLGKLDPKALGLKIRPARLELKKLGRKGMARKA